MVGSGITNTVRLREIAGEVPSLAAASIRDVLEEGLRYLQEDETRSPANTRQPYRTGLMREETTIRVVNQYVGTLESPVYYTAFQEMGFFNVWAQRWIPGRFFMWDAQNHMDEMASQIVAGYFFGE